MSEIISYLEAVGIVTCWQLLIFFVPAFVLSICVHFTSSCIEREGIRVFGMHIYLYLFAWLGTICHELGHAVFCVIFRHKINEIKFFSPNGSNGTLGHVNHSYEPKNIYQSSGNFFIGIGPIILGATVIYLAAFLLLGLSLTCSEDLVSNIVNCFVDSFSEASVLKVKYAAKMLYQTLLGHIDYQSWQLYLFLYIAFSIGSSITLSWADVKGAWSGLIVLIILVFVVNLATYWFKTTTGDSYQLVAPVLTVFYSVLLFTIMINSIAAVVLIIVSTAKSLLLGCV